MKNKKPRPNHKDRQKLNQTRPYAVHKHNPAGSKLLRRFYKAKQTIKGTYDEALTWYQSLNDGLMLLGDIGK